MSWRVRSQVENQILETFIGKLEDQEIDDHVESVITESLENTTISQQSDAESLAQEIIARTLDEID